MEILNVGPMELVFIFIIALLVLGPQGIVKAGRTLGKIMRQVVQSPTWRTVQQTSRDIRNLPNKLIREAGLDEDLQQIQRDMQMKEIQQEIKKEASVDLSPWTTPPSMAKATKPPATKEMVNSPVENQESETGSIAPPLDQEEDHIAQTEEGTPDKAKPNNNIEDQAIVEGESGEKPEES